MRQTNIIKYIYLKDATNGHNYVTGDYWFIYILMQDLTPKTCNSKFIYIDLTSFEINSIIFLMQPSVKIKNITFYPQLFKKMNLSFCIIVAILLQPYTKIFYYTSSRNPAENFATWFWYGPASEYFNKNT